MANQQALIERAAREAGVPVGLFKSLIGRGERSGVNATSPKGAHGWAQLMPGTARNLSKKYGINTSTPYGNLLGGAYYLKEQLAHFKSARLAVAAYNAGPGAVEKYHGIPPYKETQDYVRRVLGGARDVNAGISSGAGGVSTGRAEPAPDVGATFARQNLQHLAAGDYDPEAALQSLVKLQRTAKAASSAMPAGARIQGERPMQDADWSKFVKLRKGADREGVPTSQAVLAFVGGIGAAAGRSLTIGTGSQHSQMTTSGRQSAHWTGHAADIPASGAQLARLGYLALVRAGMPKKQALVASRKGGLFNVGGWQIIFNTNIGGNHYDHLHVGQRG